MSRGELGKPVLDGINARLPDLIPRLDRALILDPGTISLKFAPESGGPIASVCFNDTIHTLAGARYALFEAYAHGIYYRDHSTPPNEMVATFFERYYADDVVLRLYSAGEHLANGLILMLDITDAELAPYRTGRTSQQSVLGHFLLKERPSDAVTAAVRPLPANGHWQKAMTYRGSWTHEQPPTVAGLGITHRRESRWTTRSDDSYGLGVGGGDAPEHTITEIMSFAHGALSAFLPVFDACLVEYMKLLASHGITVTPDGTGLVLRL